MGTSPVIYIRGFEVGGVCVSRSGDTICLNTYTYTLLYINIINTNKQTLQTHYYTYTYIKALLTEGADFDGDARDGVEEGGLLVQHVPDQVRPCGELILMRWR